MKKSSSFGNRYRESTKGKLIYLSCSYSSEGTCLQLLLDTRLELVILSPPSFYNQFNILMLSKFHNTLLWVSDSSFSFFESLKTPFLSNKFPIDRLSVRLLRLSFVF